MSFGATKVGTSGFVDIYEKMADGRIIRFATCPPGKAKDRIAYYEEHGREHVDQPKKKET